MRGDRDELAYLAAVGAAAALIAAVAGPRAGAQTTVETLEVIGHKGPPSGPAVTYPVGFADLDLRSPAGQEELRRRVAVTAKYVCNRLGGMDRTALKECRENARKDGMIGARRLIREAAMSQASFHPGPAWKPPPGMK
jgi:UrcA family protein